MESIELIPEQTIVLSSGPQGFSLAAASISFRGELIRLWVPLEAAGAVFGRTHNAAMASFPESKATAVYAARLSITGAEEETWSELPGLNTTYPIVQTLPGDRVVVVGSRCTRLPDGTVELNASLYRSDGMMGAKFCLGDGIQHVQVDSEGRLWVGYFDEGVFGNFGWGFFGGQSGPIGQSGLVCFSDSGQRLWEFEPPAGLGGIYDCYALNVDENAVWACYYSDFPIVHIDEKKQTTGWETNLAGPKALAVAGDRVLAYGGYEGHRTDCSLLQLGDGRAGAEAKVQLKLSDKVDPSTWNVIGRGPLLHLFTETEWCSFRVPN